MTEEVIEIENVRNVKTLEIRVAPGLTVLQGDIGSGKSNALEAIRMHIEGAGSDGKLEPNDDADSGRVSGFGGMLRVAARTTRTGELRVTTMAGKNLERLVDPHIKDPFSADAERAKAVCEMIRLKPELAPFEDLVGGAEKLREIALPKSLGLDSVPDMAAAIKRDVEKVAQRIEGEAKNESGRAAGLRESLSGLDLTGPSDATALASACDDAVRRLATLEAEERAARNSKASGEAARKTLDATPAPESEADCESLVASASVAVTDAKAKVDAARIALSEAESAHREAATNLRAATETSQAASRARIARAAAEEAVARASQAPDPDELAQQVKAAGLALIEAGRARDQGAVIRSRLAAAKEAEAAAVRAEQLKCEASKYREIAAACEDVVTKAIRTVAPRGMSMRKGRLVVQTDRGETLFGELSKGERTMIGLDIEIDALDATTPAQDGTWRVLILAQELFEGLSPSACAAVEAKLKERNVAGITAKATDGELRAETYAKEIA